MANITDKQMTAKPGDSDRWLSEVAIWGHGSLVARITPQGERLFYFRYLNSSGSRVTYPIGTYSRSGEDGTMSLADASTKAKQLAGLHKSGIKDIKEHFEAEEASRIAFRDAELARLAQEKASSEAELKRLTGRMTVNQLFERWMQLEISARKDGGAEVRRSFEKDVLPIIGQLYVDEVIKRQITEVTDVLLARGVKNMGKVVFSLIRQMFNFAVERDFVSNNPTTSINKGRVFGKDEESDRVLAEDEIQILVIKLPESQLIISSELSVWICLSTICRIGELLSARWEHIDFVKKIWTIPASKSKNGKPHKIYLSDFAISYFRKLQQVSGYSEWCYPNEDNDNHVGPKTVTKQLVDRQRTEATAIIRGRTKMSTALILPGGHWTPHDLRRTGASMMTQLKVLPDVADLCLNHVQPNKLKRTYLRYDYDVEMKEAWIVLGKHLELITSKHVRVETT